MNCTVLKKKMPAGVGDKKLRTGPDEKSEPFPEFFYSQQKNPPSNLSPKDSLKTSTFDPIESHSFTRNNIQPLRIAFICLSMSSSFTDIIFLPSGSQTGGWVPLGGHSATAGGEWMLRRPKFT